MYMPSQFRSDDVAIIESLIRHYNFATLISNKGTEQHISHLPFFLDAKAGVIQSFMDRANPQWQHFDSDRPMTAIFHGPQSYISPNWYALEGSNVPTWNFVAIHIRGIPRVVSDEEKALQILEKLFAQHDPNWKSPEAGQRLLIDHAVFEIEALEIEAVLKLSQDREAEDFLYVCNKLLRSEQQSEREIGALMQILLDRQKD